MNLDLTVIVPAYGREAQTRGLLDSLAACSDGFSTLVVDDGSSVPLDRLVNGYRNRLDVRYIRLNRSRGPAGARNAGIREASTEFIGFTDNDCVVDPQWPSKLVGRLRKSSPLVAGAGGRVLAAGDDVFSRYYTYHRILDPFLLDGRYLYLVTASSVFRKAAVEAVGGFDEALSRPGGEDAGLCFKLLQRGLRFEYEPAAIVWHYYRRGLLDFLRTFYRYGRGCRIQADRYGQGLRQEHDDGEETFGQHG